MSKQCIGHTYKHISSVKNKTKQTKTHKHLCFSPPKLSPHFRGDVHRSLWSWQDLRSEQRLKTWADDTSLHDHDWEQTEICSIQLLKWSYGGGE